MILIPGKFEDGVIAIRYYNEDPFALFEACVLEDDRSLPVTWVSSYAELDQLFIDAYGFCLLPEVKLELAVLRLQTD